MISTIFSRPETKKLNAIAGRVFNKPIPWLERLHFYHILLIWIGMVFLFGIIYYFFSNPENYLYYVIQGRPIEGFYEAIYFSFITATSTGFGDIIPFGIFRIFSVFEVIFGLILLAIVTSKLVSIRQDLILTEIYEISFSERLNRVRSSLLLFRQNLNRLISRIEEGNFKKNDITDFSIYLASFEDYLIEVLGLFKQGKESKLSITRDVLSTELILNSVVSSFHKLNEAVTSLDHYKNQNNDYTVKLIYKCISLGEAICEELERSQKISKEKIIDFQEQRKQIISLIIPKNNS